MVRSPRPRRGVLAPMERMRTRMAARSRRRPLQAGPGGEIRLGLVAGIDAEEAEADSGKYAV